jgi:hypothetical protein
MSATPHTHARLLHGPLWPAWLAAQIGDAKHSIRIYLHRLAQPPSSQHAPMKPLWAALLAAPSATVHCQLITPLPPCPHDGLIVGLGAILSLSGAGWDVRYLSVSPAPVCRLYLFDAQHGAIGDYDMLNSHLNAKHLHALALLDAACTRTLEQAFDALWLAGQPRR